MRSTFGVPVGFPVTTPYSVWTAGRSHADLQEERLVIYGVVNGVVTWKKMIRGSTCSVGVSPREIAVHVLAQPKTQEVILVHNHPSGSCAPSIQDKSLTARISWLLSELGTPLWDHIIVSRTEWYSMAEHTDIGGLRDVNLF